MDEQGDSLFNRLSESFLRGDYQRTDAERQRIEALIQQEALSQKQFVQYNQLIIRYERVKGALAEAQNTVLPQTALGILADALQLEPRFLPALSAKVTRLMEASTDAMRLRDPSQSKVTLDRAAAACRNAIELYPTWPDGHLMHGVIIFVRCQLSKETFGNVEMHSLKQAAVDTSKAIDLLLDQGHPASEIAAAWKQKGRIYRLRGDALDSLYSQRVDSSGSESPATDKIADRRDAAWDHAISAFSRAIELDGSDWEAFTECGETLLCVDRISDSIPYLVEAVRIAPESLLARVGLIHGLDLAGAGRLGKDFYITIMDHCLYVLETNPADFDVRYVLSKAFGTVLDEDPNNEQALRVLNRLLDRWLPALTINPTDENGRAQLQDVLPHLFIHNPRHPKALEALNRLSAFDHQRVKESYLKLRQRANRPR